MQSKQIPVFLVYDDPDHIPLAIGMIVAFCKQYKNGKLSERFRFLPTTNLSTNEVLKVGQAFGPAVWFFSNYVWTTARCLKISQRIKQANIRHITVHGGPNVAAYEKANSRFLVENPHVDFTVRGEGEETAAELLEFLAENWTADNRWAQSPDDVKGISFINPAKRNLGVIRTPDRPRSMDLDRLPSAYLTGVFDRGYLVDATTDTPPTMVGATIETNRGCPYKCTFCDWGSLTNQKIAQFNLERVKAEIEWTAKRQIPLLIVADANFGIFKRDLEIAEFAAETKQRYGFPREFQVSFAKNDSSKRTQIVKTLLDAGLAGQGIVSIQSRDQATLAAVKRTNIRSDHYDSLAQLFQQEKMPLATELMLGLPGATVDSFKADLQFYFDRNVLVRVNPTRLLVNSPMADPAYVEKFQIVTLENSDRVVSTASYTREDYKLMLDIYSFYRLFVRYSVLTYVMRFLQWEMGVNAADFLHHAVMDAPKQLPGVAKSVRVITESKYPRELVNYMFEQGQGVFQELAGYIRARYGIDDGDSCLQSVLRVNEAVIPSRHRTYPLRIEITHDFPEYFHSAMKNEGKPERPLQSYPACEFVVSDPHEICQTIRNNEHFRFNPYQTYFELESELKVFNSPPHWLKLKRPSY